MQKRALTTRLKAASFHWLCSCWWATATLSASSLCRGCCSAKYFRSSNAPFPFYNWFCHYNRLYLARVNSTIHIYGTYFKCFSIFINQFFVLILRSRGIATGITAAGSYVMAFIASKTYYNLESFLSLPGVSMLYACIGVIGLIIGYFIIPETENRTLEDIELHFSDNTRKLTDRKIPKNAIGKDLKMPTVDSDNPNGFAEKSPSVVVNMILNDRRNDTNANAGICNKAFTPDSWTLFPHTHPDRSIDKPNVKTNESNKNVN